MLLTIVFLAAAAMALGVIATSFAKGFAAVSSVRRELALGGDARVVTVRHGRTTRAPTAVTLRASRRQSRPAPVLAQAARQRVAA